MRCRCGASNTTVGVVWRRELRWLRRGIRLYVPTWRSQHPPPPKRAPHRRVHRGSANNVTTGWPNPLALDASAHPGATLSCATVSSQVRHPLRCDATTPKDPPIAVCTARGPRQDTPVLWKLDDTRENSAAHENTVHRRFGSTGRSTAAKHGRFTRFHRSR